MQKRLIAGLVAVVGLGFGAGLAVGQGQPDRVQTFKSELVGAALFNRAKDNKDLASLLGSAVGDRELTQGVGEVSIEADKSTTKGVTNLTVLQVMQNQKFIEQNEEVIRLLKEAAAKR